ncbi:uncharacterized protein [Dysidea avara]|uniref:uncharacterized protein isoform X2 n=1 Tax=Dysidea avara TaxID=196820 RepID=UPI0033167A10
MMDNMMLLLLVLPLDAFSYTYDYMGPPFVYINCTTDHEAQTHTINIFWKVDPPTNLNLTPAQISYRLADARADIDCDSTNRTVANDYSRTSDDISDKHQLSYEISTNYQYYESCEVLVFYDDFDDPFQNFSITTTVKECQLEVPSIVLSTPSNMTAHKGSTFKISFEYYAVPPPNYTWYINDEFYGTVIGAKNNGIHTMVFTAIQEGWYRCLLENSFGTDVYAVFVNILETTITEAPVNIADTLEGSVTFTCTATGIPLPNITWSSDSNDSIAATSNMILGNITIQSNLTLSFLQRDDFMNYTCTAVNEFGIDSRTAVLGMVPKILQGPQSISELQGTVANFNCSASGIPPPTILWTFTNNNNEVTALNSTRNYKDSENVMGELDLLGVTKDNFGTYSCIAVNIFDTDAEAATLVVKSIVTNVTEPPVPVTKPPVPVPVLPDTTMLDPTATGAPTVIPSTATAVSTSTPSDPPSNTSSSSPTIIIILSIAAFIICFVIIFIFLGVAVYRWRRKSFLSKDATKYMMLFVDNDSYYLSIGRDAASTIESLSMNEEIIKWIQETELQTNNEECKSNVSDSTTNEEMLNYLYGYKNSLHKSEKHRILSDSILSSRDRTEYYYHKSKNLANIITEESIGELLHTNTNHGLTAVETSSTKTSIQENSKFISRSDSGNHLPGNNIQGQYMDYHTAVDLTVDSGHGSISSQPQDFTSPITNANLPENNDSVFSYSPSDGNYVDHGVAFSMDSAIQSVNSVVGHPKSLSIPPEASSVSDDQCATPTTGVYQSYNIAVDHDDITVDDANGLQLI